MWSFLGLRETQLWSHHGGFVNYGICAYFLCSPILMVAGILWSHVARLMHSSRVSLLLGESRTFPFSLWATFRRAGVRTLSCCMYQGIWYCLPIIFWFDGASLLIPLLSYPWTLSNLPSSIPCCPRRLHGWLQVRLGHCGTSFWSGPLTRWPIVQQGWSGQWCSCRGMGSR